MKKIFSSLALIAVFTAYVAYRRGYTITSPSVPLPNIQTSTVSSSTSSIDPSGLSPVPSSTSSSAPTQPVESQSAASSLTSSPAPASLPPKPPVAPPPVSSAPPPPASSSSTQNQGNYRNGLYTGASADAYYGNVQVKVKIQNGKIADVQFLDYPQDRGNSIQINTYAMPILKSEAIQAQATSVDIVSGATETSLAFIQSLASALAQAS